MTIREANRIMNAFDEAEKPGSEEIAAFVEAAEFLIDKTKDPFYMVRLGGYYYGARRFDLALKYYELAAEYDSVDALVGLGYIWYYGRTGQCDYEKAFRYYSKAADLGDLACRYKVADMYRNGYYVEKDLEKYARIIEELYPIVCNARSLWEPLPEIFTRLARIRMEQGRNTEALELLLEARDFLAQRIACNPFFGNLSIMQGLMADMAKLRRPDPRDMQLYDLYQILETPAAVTFRREDEEHRVESVLEDGECVICFRGKWYRSTVDFFAKASLDGRLLTTIFDELYDFELCGGDTDE